ncbi:MAG: endonuclease III [Paludibacteraceae bacterium]|nr:endonuclease III [Paludibacteraceae bacterium]
MTLAERYKNILNYFQQHVGKVDSELHYSNEFELLVAVMLSAQCTDKRVNMVTPSLFKRFPSSKELSEATATEVFSYIKSISYPNAKTTHLIAMAKLLEERFWGKVPQTMEELTSLPGVGRKTANVVLAVAFGIGAMPVDTHVLRVSNRIGLAKSDSPLEVEKRLVKYIPKEMLIDAHHWLLLHGRYVCLARKPKCEECNLFQWCKKVGVK